MNNKENRKESALRYSVESYRKFRKACEAKGVSRGALYDRLTLYPISLVMHTLELSKKGEEIIGVQASKERTKKDLTKTKDEIEILLELFPDDVLADEWKQAIALVDDYLSKL
jgi:hypothetical protein